MSSTESRSRVIGTRAKPPANSSRTGSTPDEEIIRIAVVLEPSPLPGDHPVAMRHQALKQSHPNDRARLGHDDLALLFSPDTKHVNAVKAFAADYGLTVVSTSDARHDVVLEGTASAMNDAFGIKLEQFEHESGTCRAHHDDIRLPDELRNIVVGVLGLNNVPLTYPAANESQRSTDHFTPVQLADHYQFPDATGTGYRIAILSFGDSGYYPADIDRFFADVVGIKAPAIRNHSVNKVTCNPLPWNRLVEMTEYFKNGRDPVEPFSRQELNWGKATLETTMDIQIAGGVANGAEIDVYFSSPDAYGVYEAIYAALGLSPESEGVDKNTGTNHRELPAAISISWGASEAEWGMDGLRLMDRALEKAQLMHMTVCCSSGDFGSVNEFPATRPTESKVNYPASSPHALACGGTRFELDHSTNRQVEASWKAKTLAGQEASGGGISGYFELPDFQATANVPAHNELRGKAWLVDGKSADFKGRGVPDVAAYADVGYVTFIGGQTYVNGGTSASTPLWAGLVARLSEKLGRRVGWLNETIYHPDLQAAFQSVRTGDNKVVDTEAAFFTAHEGWNACCGLGVPTGNSLLACLQKSGDRQ